jgi:mycothiol synthase
MLTATDTLTLAGAPALPGLRFRRFAGPSDYPHMINILTASKDADGLEDVDTLETLTHNYAHLVNCHPAEDMLMMEMNDALVGYARVWWMQEEKTRARIYSAIAFLTPQWRGRGIGRAVLAWQEARLQAIAATHPADGPRAFQIPSSEAEKAKTALIERFGYTPVRYFYEMIRPSLDDIPAAPLPAGLEVRTVQPEHLRAIWDASVEAFRDHWGYVTPTEESYQQWLGSEEFQPDIWKVAWDIRTNTVAGMVLGFINPAQNQKYRRLRGWTENISTVRAWRKRGVARALIAENLRELKARGMTEAELGVDTQNLTGALRVYESMGFRATKRFATYRKDMPPSA